MVARGGIGDELQVVHEVEGGRCVGEVQGGRGLADELGARLGEHESAEGLDALGRAAPQGQRRDVVVYRMIMAASVEEKMYEKQVFKDGMRVVSESGALSASRYFSKVFIYIYIYF